MELVNGLVEQYAKNYCTPLNDLLLEVLQYTLENHPESHMISGEVQGQFLRMISKMAKPKNILEIGTFTGFSALCLVEGLNNEGSLHTIELRENDAEVARSFFNRSNYKNNIHLHIGEAKEIVKTLEIEWDIVFIDADKVSYFEYYELTLPRLKQGGFIIADNVLFHGQVMSETIKGKNAIAIQEFNNKVQADNRVESILLTVRDGLMLIWKK